MSELNKYMDEALLTPQELSLKLKVALGTIYYWTSKKEIPFVKIGRHIRFSWKEIINYFERKNAPCPRVQGLLKQGKPSSLKTRDADHADLQKRSKYGNL